MADRYRPKTLEGCYHRNPEGFRALLEDAEDLGLDIVADPMRATIEEVEADYV